MKTVYQVIYTLLIIILFGFVLILSGSVVGSSHNIPALQRYFFLYLGYAAMILGPIGIVLIWFPRKRKNENDLLKFDEEKYATEMASMIFKAIAILHIDHPSFEIYTVCIVTNPKDAISSISIDNKENSDEKINVINTLNKQRFDYFIKEGNAEKAKTFDAFLTRNCNPEDFKLKELYHIQNKSFQAEWGLNSEEVCWNTLGPAMKKLGERFYYEFKKLHIHPDFELAINGSQQTYACTWNN